MNAPKPAVFALLLVAGLGAGELPCGAQGAVASRTFYVDYVTGDDSRAGTSPASSWKHCPGDAKASASAAAARLGPGDTVIFKGGVVYPGELDLKFSGAPGKPIVFDGNSSGQFGVGRAVFSGAQELSGWKRCISPEDAGGAKVWRSCYYVDLPQAVDPLALNFFVNGKRGVLAREPDAVDPMWWQDLETFSPVADEDIKPTSLRLPPPLAAPAGENWNGAYAGVWTRANHIELKQVSGVSADGRTLSFDEIPIRRTANRFALFNHPRLLDTKDEYAVINGGKRVLVHAGEAPNAPRIEISPRRYGINLNGKSHLTIRHLTFRNFAGDYESRRAGAGIISWQTGAERPESILVEDCESVFNQSLAKVAGLQFVGVRKLHVRKCRISENQGGPGILLSGCEEVVVEDNDLVRNGGTGMRIFGSQEVRIENNRLSGHLGMHANGISMYLGSRNVQVLRNTVTGGNIPVTIQSSKNLILDYNIFTTERPSPALAIWPPTKEGPAGDIIIRNNVLLTQKDNGLINSDKAATGLIIQNNIISGSLIAHGVAAKLANNLYTVLSWQQQKPEWQWEPGAVRPVQGQPVFVNSEKGDYRLARGSAAIDAGTPWGAKTDLPGNPVNGLAPDIGAYEYQQTR